MDIKNSDLLAKPTSAISLFANEFECRYERDGLPEWFFTKTNFKEWLDEKQKHHVALFALRRPLLEDGEYFGSLEPDGFKWRHRVHSVTGKKLISIHEPNDEVILFEVIYYPEQNTCEVVKDNFSNIDARDFLEIRSR